MSPVLSRRRWRGALDRAARWSGLLALLERGLRGGLTVLMYHRVLDDERCADAPIPSLVMPASAFRAQVGVLARRCEVLPIATALTRVELGRLPMTWGQAGRPLVALSFDDGYADNAEIAAPILETAGVRATFFVTSGFVAGTPLWFDRAAQLFARAPRAELVELTRTVLGAATDGTDAARWIETLKRLSPIDRDALLERIEAFASDAPAEQPGPRNDALTPGALRALVRAGHEIGAHSVTHAILTGLDDAALDREVSSARSALSAWSGRSIEGFAYPNGNHDARVMRAVERAGYRYACVTRPGIHRRGSDPLRIARIDVAPEHVHDARGQHDVTAFRCEMARFHEVWR